MGSAWVTLVNGDTPTANQVDQSCGDERLQDIEDVGRAHTMRVVGCHIGCRDRERVVVRTVEHRDSGDARGMRNARGSRSVGEVFDQIAAGFGISVGTAHAHTTVAITLLAERAYMRAGPWVMTPLRRPPGRDLTPTRQSVNRALSAARPPVARGAARLKS